MALKSAFIVRTPDGDPDKHISTIETSLHTVITVIVSDQQQAIDECKRLAQDEGVHLLYLCPAFTNEQVGPDSKRCRKESRGNCSQRRQSWIKTHQRDIAQRGLDKIKGMQKV